MTKRQKSINKMLKLAQRLNEIVEELQIKKESMLDEMHRKAA